MPLASLAHAFSLRRSIPSLRSPLPRFGISLKQINSRMTSEAGPSRAAGRYRRCRSPDEDRLALSAEKGWLGLDPNGEASPKLLGLPRQVDRQVPI